MQHWMSEMNNDVKIYADHNTKMRIYRKFKTKENYKCEVCFRQVTNTPRGIILKKIAIKQSQNRHRNGPIFKTK